MVPAAHTHSDSYVVGRIERSQRLRLQSLLPHAREARTRGRVIGVSVGCFCCVFVCGHKNEQFERNRAVYELYLLRTSQKSKNINFYIPHERERTSGSQEKQTFKIFRSIETTI